jgi:peroxiredoxin
MPHKWVLARFALFEEAVPMRCSPLPVAACLVVVLASAVVVAPWRIVPGPLSARADAVPSPIGKHIEDFELIDTYGRRHALRDIEQPLVVVVFLGTECPLAKLYGPRLELLRERFADRRVAFLAIDSNSQDTLTELASFGQRNKLKFPLLKDPNNRVADQFGAVRTPEAFVLDAERAVRYWGRIDDQYGVGYLRPSVGRQDLAEALEELLAGKPVSTPVAEAVGCHIGRVIKREPVGDVNYSRHISPIFNARCVECHRPGQIAPFSLTSYEETQGWGATIVEVIRENRMPPWSANPEFGHFSNDMRLTDDMNDGCCCNEEIARENHCFSSSSERN